ncbi:MAG: sulfatase-like hydrolase/transferase, partial [Candidatus Contendobacter sp.]|nr:sulfatase-like hydrolase/transferase [Candidatus Contendobacter sp.]
MKILSVTFVVIMGLAASLVHAADQGPRHHAQGQYDTATTTYVVVEGDDLDAIAGRFGVTLEELTKASKLSSTKIKVGQQLAIPAGTSGDTKVEVTGVLGSPAATTTIPGNQLPAPAPKFGGVIKDDALQSKPWWPPRVVPPKGAPNILLILTDDAGFAVPSTFGGVIPTPTMDRIAENGLRYNRMFSTSLCSPTRAALIT